MLGLGTSRCQLSAPGRGPCRCGNEGLVGAALPGQGVGGGRGGRRPRRPMRRRPS